MKILYLSTYIEQKDFDRGCLLSSSKPNPAGQNFHEKLVKALGKYNEVIAFSLIPFGLQVEPRTFVKKNVTFRYFSAKGNKYVRYLALPRAICSAAVEAFQGQEKPILFFDPLNLTLSKASKMIAKKLGCPRFAILTDHPGNISGVNDKYAKRVFSLSSSADGSYSLTPELVKAYGLSDKPTLIQPMLVDVVEIVSPKQEAPYIYYGGALYEKDGLRALLDAYKKYQPDYDLCIAGHGPYEPQIVAAAKACPRIHYLGQISQAEHCGYIQNAALCINPRLYRREIDDHAVPSKVMEYLLYGTFVASTLSTPIREQFPSSINWIEGSLNEFMEEHLGEDKKFRGLIQNASKEEIQKRFGIGKTAEKLNELLVF